MSGEIEKCENITKHVGPCGDTVPMMVEEECGLDLQELSKADPQLAELFAVARQTGSADILSQTDALKKALVDNIVNRRDQRGYRASCMDASDYRLNSCCSDPEMCARSEAENRVDKTGVNAMLKSLPADRGAAVQKQAQAFLDNARALIERLRPPVQQPVPRERPEYFRGRFQ